MAGLDSTGLTILRLDEIQAEIRASIASSPALGALVQTGADTAIGELADIMAGRYAELWELCQALYDSMVRDNASGILLDHLSGVVGVIREPATPSTIASVTLNGTPTTVIPAGSRWRLGTGGTGAIFAIDVEQTIGGGGSVTGVTCTAEDTGPQQALTGATTSIVDAVAGWDSVDIDVDAVVGSNVESDTELQIRTERSLAISGSTREQAIRAKLEQIADVQAAVVVSNRSLDTDANGTPGKTLWAILWPTTVATDEIATVLWSFAPAGIAQRGTQTAVVTDSQGYQQTVAWDWATERDLWVIADLTVDTDYPAGGDAAVLAAIAAVEWTVGETARPDKIRDAIYAAAEGIVHAVVRIKFGSSPGATDTVPLSVAVNELVTIDSGDVVVNS